MYHLVFIIIVVTAIFLSVRLRKLTFAGGITGGIIAIAIYLGTGYTGIALLGTFFLLATAATRFAASRQILNTGNERRTAGQVIANGGVAALVGLAAIVFPEYHKLLLLMLAGSLSSATADTMSSELGTIFGKSFYNILSLRADIRGENGVVSLEGTLWGLLGSVLIAAVYAACTELDLVHAVIIILAGTLGNITDSIMGATLERAGKISNNTVNFLNTFTAAAVAAVLYFLI